MNSQSMAITIFPGLQLLPGLVLSGGRRMCFWYCFEITPTKATMNLKCGINIPRAPRTTHYYQQVTTAMLNVHVSRGFVQARIH